jgi:hypothetical protein
MYSKFLETTDPIVSTLPVTTTSSSAINGAAVDRLGYLSAGLLFQSGVNPSIPTGVVAALKVQHSDTTTSGDFTDFITSIPNFGSASDLTAASATKYYNLDLTGAKRYVRTVTTFTFTGGSSPSMIFTTAFVLGDKNVEPANAAVVYSAD